MCRVPVSDEDDKISWCSLWSRSMMLWSVHTENTMLITRWIIFDILRPYLITILQRQDTFCQFCGIYVITNIESRLEVTRGRWFLPARRYAGAGNSDRNVSVCPSVRLSVTRRYCVKTKKASLMISVARGPQRGAGCEIQRFSSFKRQYLENGSRYGQSYKAY